MSKKLPKYLCVEEIDRLLNAPYAQNKRDRIMLALGAKCGLRASEIISLKYGDIRRMHPSEYCVLMIRGGKGGKDRVVPIPPELFHLMNNSLDPAQDFNNYIFDMSYQGFYKLVKKYGERAEIHKKVTPHMLRHTFAVHRILAGMDIVSLQKILGHSSINTTRIYLELTQEDVMQSAIRHPLPY